MPSNVKSAFATSFQNAVNRGVPCGVAVETIARKTNKTPAAVFGSLFKAGLCFRQKINGQFVYWPCFGVPGTSTSAKTMQTSMWQCFVDWCITSGCCTPAQLRNCCGSQTAFMDACKKFFGKQVTGFAPVKARALMTGNGRTTVRGRSTKTVGARRTSARTYGMGRKNSTKRYRSAA